MIAMSAFGGKADIAIALRKCPLMTQSGHDAVETRPRRANWPFLKYKRASAEHARLGCVKLRRGTDGGRHVQSEKHR
jgi:hypothetical protein